MEGQREGDKKVIRRDERGGRMRGREGETRSLKALM